MKRGKKMPASVRAEIIDWYKKVRALGSAKQLAAKLDISTGALRNYINRWRAESMAEEHAKDLKE